MRKIFSVIIILAGLVACKSDNKKNLQQDSAAKGIKRYEVALFNIDTSDFTNGIREIYPDYNVFMGNQVPDESGIKQLREFVTDPHMRSTYNYTMQQFPDLTWLFNQLDKSFTIYKKHFPKKQIPTVYSYISGYDIQMPVKFADSVLIIGLDMYLGRDYPPYKEMGYPVYIINRLSKEYILSDCFKEIGWANTTRNRTSTLLDAMIEEGKALYFTQVMLPGEPGENLMKYSPEQLAWIEANEQNLWSFMIENQLLYSTDAKAITTFMTDGPFTSGFSTESPSRMGHWLGWQIVKAYMNKNSVSLPDLMATTDSQTILQKSGYKPVRL